MSSIWFITGASRGLGRALAEHVAAQGDRVVAAVRKPGQLRELQAAYPQQLAEVILDVTEPQAKISACLDEVVQTHGRLDVVVNNAGYGAFGAVEEMAEEVWRAQVETNLFGPVKVTRAALPHLRRQGSGHIIQVSSLGGRLGSPGLAFYHLTKWGLEGFSEALANELRPLGVHVTVVQPGGMRTDWAGASMVAAPDSGRYEAVSRMKALLEQIAGRETIQPQLAAAIIYQASRIPEPPLQLVLGDSAFDLAKTREEARLAELLRWEQLSRSAEAAAKSGEGELRAVAAVLTGGSAL